MGTTAEMTEATVPAGDNAEAVETLQPSGA